MEITLKIDRRSKQAKALLAYLKTLPFIEVGEKSSYSPSFVKKINQSLKEAEEGKTTTMDTDDIWGSLGLK